MATKTIAWDTGTGNIRLTYQGQGNGAITVNSDENNLGSARSQTVTVKTTDNTKSKTLTINQAANPFPVGTVKNYNYTGSYQTVTLIPGTYKLQCWGAQGGSNAAASSYSITAKAGGKGGYSEGVLTITQSTTIRIYVGGQGSSSAGGYNGGGSTTGSSVYSANDEYGTSRMGGGGGATDIRLNDGSLYSRMIVAGGGSGGAMCYRAVTTYTTEYTNLICTLTMKYTNTTASGAIYRPNGSTGFDMWQYLSPNTTYKVVPSASYNVGAYFTHRRSGGQWVADDTVGSDGMVNISSKRSTEGYLDFTIYNSTQMSDFTVYIYGAQQVPYTTTSTLGQEGYAGGGTSGIGYSSAAVGSQSSGYAFGEGMPQTGTALRYCSGAGGGGWYGGRSSNSRTTMSEVQISGGGSGWVNTAASAGNRPSGFSSLQLDSGTTYAGNTSFPSTSGGTETGHSGNGYAKITRLS